METGNFYKVLGTPGVENKGLQSQLDVLLNSQFENSLKVKKMLVNSLTC